MTEYIKRANLAERIKYYITHTPEDSGEHYAWSIALNEVLNCPTADVAPVVHGKWIEKQEETYCPVQYGEDAEPILHRYIRYICNLCGRSSRIPEPYCHCGAKMEGSEE